MKCSSRRPFAFGLSAALTLLFWLPPASAAAAGGEAGRLSGRIVDAESGAPIAEAWAWVFTADGVMSPGSAYSDESGSFAIENLAPGTYFLLADGPGLRDLLVGGDEACTVRNDDYRFYATCDPTRGAPFSVGSGETVDSGETRLPAEGRVRGTLRLDEGRVALPFVRIYSSSHRLVSELYPPGRLNEWTYDLPVPGGGTYYLAGLAPEHRVQVYDHADCGIGELYCTDFSAGRAVTVAPGERREGLDFDLHLDRRACRPSPTTLCLLGGRFSVRGHHFGPHAGDGGPSPAARITEEAGYFTFFDAANVEVVVKVLDACENFGAFWVYTTGLTDVLNTLEVRDNWAAESQRYDHYGVGRPYLPRVDRATFAACGLGPPGPEPEAADAVAAAPPPAPVPELMPNGCGSDPATSLCLGGRFRVEASFTTAEGHSGGAVPAPLTADTGFFHFFSPGNIEVVVKVLDACRADLGNRYWVFAAGMTDVAVTLEVTDTATGEQQVYLSPLGGLFPPIFDLGAFAGCP